MSTMDAANEGKRESNRAVHEYRDLVRRSSSMNGIGERGPPRGQAFAPSR